MAHKNCVHKILEQIEFWNSHHNPGEHSEETTAALGTLCDLAPKLRGKTSEEAQFNLLQGLMHPASDMKRGSEGNHFDWQVDFLSSTLTIPRYSTINTLLY